ncbi:MAG: hypothetical protein HY885_06680 [Deltaproteobacteria bacterium]|nr:hypothetical protein [Deltaproteobacteria bacterium]
MIVLGINDSHDASACLVKDGDLLVALSEERVQRIKSTGGFPHGAIGSCLHEAGITRKDIDYVALATERLVPNNIYNVNATFTVADFLRMHEEYFYPRIYKGVEVKFAEVFSGYKPCGDLLYPLDKVPFITSAEFQGNEEEEIQRMRSDFAADYFGIDKERVIFVNHHKSHAYYSYYITPEKQAKMAIVTSDSGGDSAYTSISIVDEKGITKIWEDHDSLIGKIYTAVTLQLGMRPNEHEYKVMGLAPYASEFHKKGPREVFLNALQVDGLGFQRNPAMKDFFFYFRDQLKPYRFDGIAGGLQDFVEIRLNEWFNNIGKKAGTGHFIFSGGVANNVKANKKLCELDAVETLFIPPGPGDESLAIGAAYSVICDKIGHHEAGKRIKSKHNAYWGPDIVEDDCAKFRDHPYVKKHFRAILNCGLRQVAEIIAQGEVVALCFGRMEFGSRALGHRSLVADPSKPEIVRKINDLIKKRDFWMPFTPSILDENYDEYVVDPKHIGSPYMTITFDSTEEGRSALKAANHPYDYTVRPQKITAAMCPIYYELIHEFKKITGIGALLNTSLNIHGKPIVNKPIDIINEILLPQDIPLKYILVGSDLYIRNEDQQ